LTDSSAPETELKLSIDPKKLQDIVSVTPAGWVASNRRSKKLLNHYYDTVDLRFLNARCSLRVRQSERRFTQTIKYDHGSDALHSRMEQNRELTDRNTTMPTIEVPQMAAQIGFLFPDDLVTVFSNHFDRQSVELTGSETGTVVELAYDRGRIRSGRKQQAFAEVEIELLQGRPSDLYRLARMLLRCGPLYLSGETNSARG